MRGAPAPAPAQSNLLPQVVLPGCESKGRERGREGSFFLSQHKPSPRLGFPLRFSRTSMMEDTANEGRSLPAALETPLPPPGYQPRLQTASVQRRGQCRFGKWELVPLRPGQGRSR